MAGVVQRPALAVEGRAGTPALPEQTATVATAFSFLPGRGAQTFISVAALAALFTYILLRTNNHKVLHMGLDLEITQKHN